MIAFYATGCLIIYAITSKFIRLIPKVNDFFFELFLHPLMDLFHMTNVDHFRSIADPVQFIVTATILFFIGLAEKMNALKSKSTCLISSEFSQVSIIMILYMMVMTAAQLPYYQREEKRIYKRFETDPLVLLKNLGTFIFVYFGVNNYHQAYTTVKFPTVRRMAKMSRISMSILLIFMIVFGLTAYFSIGQELITVPLFPDRKPLKHYPEDYMNKILKTSKPT